MAKDDVFALVKVYTAGEGLRTVRDPWTLLQVQEVSSKDGLGTCRLYRQGRPLPLAGGGGIAGYRCLKLGTIQAPLRLRLVKARDPARSKESGPHVPAPNLGIQVRRHGFTGEDTTKVQGTSDADGWYSTEGMKDIPLFDRVAFVSIHQLGVSGPRNRVPLALVDDGPIECQVAAGVSESNQFSLRKTLWEQDIFDELSLLRDRFKDFNESLSRPNTHEQTLEAARRALTDVEEGRTTLTNVRTELASLVGTAGAKQLETGDILLEEVKKGRDQLSTFIDSLKEILKEEKDPARLKAQTMITRRTCWKKPSRITPRLLELYEQALPQVEDMKLREHVNQLKKDWEPRGDKHAAARKFIFETWPNSETSPAAMKDLIKEAEKALQECRAVKDLLGPKRLLRVALGHSARVIKQIKELHPDVNKGDLAQAEELTKVSEALAQLIKDTNTYLEQGVTQKK